MMSTLGHLARVSTLAMGMIGSDCSIESAENQLRQELVRIMVAQHVQERLRECIERRIRQEVQSSAVFGFVSLDDFMQKSAEIDGKIHAASALGDCPALMPSKLQGDEDLRRWVAENKIFYIRSHRQSDGYSCGHWALAHARALSDSVAEGVVDFDRFLERSQEYYEINLRQAEANRERDQEKYPGRDLAENNQQLGSDQLQRVVDIWNNAHRHAHTVVMSPQFSGGREIPPIPESIFAPHLVASFAREGRAFNQFWEDRRAERFQEIKDNQFPEPAHVLNFICRIELRAKKAKEDAAPSHWVLISIVWLPGREAPCMLIFDSAQFSVHHASFMDYVKLIYERFIAPPRGSVVQE